MLQVLMYAQLRGNSQNVVKITAGALTGPAGVAAEGMRPIQEGPLSVQLDGGKRLGMLAVEAAVAQALDRCQQRGFGLAGTCNTSSSTGALGCEPLCALLTSTTSVLDTFCLWLSPDMQFDILRPAGPSHELPARAHVMKMPGQMKDNRRVLHWVICGSGPANVAELGPASKLALLTICSCRCAADFQAVSWNRPCYMLCS